MRIHRSVRMGLAMGVMLVTGGCAADVLAPEPAPAPREASVVEAPAGKAEESSVSREARPRIRICQCGGPQGPERPLLFVDGEEIPQSRVEGQLLELYPNRIESIEILKGQHAISVYGERAAGGAVLIRTKRP